MSFIKVIHTILFIIVSVSTISCNENSKQHQTTLIVDSIRNVELSFPDSFKNIDLENAKTTISDYFENADRFFLDTVSTLSSSSIAQKDRAQDLRKRLLKVLPKVSLTTGVDDNKFTRDYYIVEGDIKLDRDALLLYCKKRLQKTETSFKEKSDSRKLTVATDLNGQPSIWPRGAIIKYCIMRSSFSSKSAYDSVKNSMNQATNDWMKVCNIKFQYLSNLDNQSIDVETFPEPIFFVVRQINSYGAFIAQSFFPNDPAYERLLYIDNSFFTSPFSKTGILRHELGHILGFRHEHIWSQDASCNGENVIEQELGAKPITAYDPYSVMHYPCGLNKENRLLNLTNFDKTGALKVYPF